MKSYPQIRRALSGKLFFIHEPKMQEMLAFLEFKLAGGIDSAGSAQKHSRDQPGGRHQGTKGNGRLRLNCGHSHLRDDHASPDGGHLGRQRWVHRRMPFPRPFARWLTILASVRSFSISIPRAAMWTVSTNLASRYFTRLASKRKSWRCRNCLCASAAYYVASQASEVVVSPSSLTGSIGVYTMHEDDSAMLESNGHQARTHQVRRE